MITQKSFADSGSNTSAHLGSRGIILLVSLVLLSLLLQGCVALQVRRPLPEHLLDQVEVADLPGIRSWGDVYSETLEQSAIESIKQEMAAKVRIPPGTWH